MTMKLGVCYYPEHWPPERWALDARQMRAAGLMLVRIAEFAWQRMEPVQGRFEWTWLDQAIETLAAEGLQVILGTPTATPPAWLTTAHPEVLPVDSEGRRRQHGSRRHYCVNVPVYQAHTRRIVQAMAGRYKDHPAVVGWQIDNEFGCHDSARCYCDCCAAAFRSWLEKRYGSLAALNDAWGAVFWSQAYSDWLEIKPPNLTLTEPNPSHVLDYARFSSDSVVAYQQIQIDTLRSILPARQWITHNLMGNFPDLDYHDLGRSLDFVTWDSYPTGYAEVQAAPLYDPAEARPALAFDVGDPYVTGYCHDIMRGVRQAPFWVMEQQCGNVNWSVYNTGVRSGAVRLWTWHALGSGADAVLYFRWRACRYAQEQYHSGLLHHDASPDVGYGDVLNMLPERELMDACTQEPVRTQVAMLYDFDDLWALQLQPHRKDFGYQRHQFIYYRALQHLGIPVDLVSRQADLSSYRLVLAPTAFLVDEALAARLTAFVKNGGSLMLGVRSGFKTSGNLVTDQPLPGALRQLAGASVTAWHALPPGIVYSLSQAVIPALDQAATWAEALRPDLGGRSLATYGSGPFAGLSALTENLVGAGRVVYVGLYPSLAQAEGLLAWLAETAGVERLAELPEGMLACRRGAYTLLLNFAEMPQVARLQGEEVSVEGRGVKVVRR